jgi:hypothetical protein
MAESKGKTDAMSVTAFGELTDRQSTTIGDPCSPD